MTSSVLKFQILQCAAMWPKLETLHACFNCVSTMTDASSPLPNVKLLNLESNPINSWEQVLKLGNMPRYVHLLRGYPHLQSLQPANLIGLSLEKQFVLPIGMAGEALLGSSWTNFFVHP